MRTERLGRVDLWKSFRYRRGTIATKQGAADMRTNDLIITFPNHHGNRIVRGLKVALAITASVFAVGFAVLAFACWLLLF